MSAVLLPLLKNGEYYQFHWLVLGFAEPSSRNTFPYCLGVSSWLSLKPILVMRASGFRSFFLSPAVLRISTQPLGRFYSLVAHWQVAYTRYTHTIHIICTYLKQFISTVQLHCTKRPAGHVTSPCHLSQSAPRLHLPLNHAKSMSITLYEIRKHYILLSSDGWCVTLYLSY